MAFNAEAFAGILAKATECGGTPTTIALPRWSINAMVRLGWYDPTQPMAYLDHVKRTSPKPRPRRS